MSIIPIKPKEQGQSVVKPRRNDLDNLICVSDFSLVSNRFEVN